MKRKVFLDQFRRRFVLRYIPTFSKYIDVLSTQSSFPFFSPRSDTPSVKESPPLYILSPCFHPSLPLVDQISDLLDVYPIRTFLKPLCVAIRLNITVHASLPYKCGKLVKCRAFNVVVLAFFSDIS